MYYISVLQAKGSEHHYSIRVPKKLKEEIERYKIKVSELVRKFLEEEIRKRKRRELENNAEELGEFFSKLSREEIVEVTSVIILKFQ